MPDDLAGFDVINMVRRRRRWTSEQKLALVEEIDQPGSSLAAVADRHGVSRSLLFDWRRQLREGRMPEVSRVADSNLATGFAPVRLIEDVSAASAMSRPASPCLARRPRAVPIIELALRNGRVLRVAETIAPATLARLAAVLDG